MRPRRTARIRAFRAEPGQDGPKSLTPGLAGPLWRQRTCIPFKGAIYILHARTAQLSVNYVSVLLPLPRLAEFELQKTLFPHLSERVAAGFLLLLFHLPRIHPTAFLFHLCVLTCYVCLYFCDSRVGFGWPHRWHRKKLQKKPRQEKKKTRASKKITGGVKGAKAQQQAQCSFFIAPVEKNEKNYSKKVCHFLPTQNDNVYAGEETELSFFCTRLFVFYVMQKKNNSFC